MSILPARLRQHALARPGTCAVQSGDACISYAQLWADVQRVAELLRQHEVRSLGLYLDNGIDWIVIDLAGIAAGIRLVPLPWFFSREQLAHAIEDARVDSIVSAAALPGGIVGTGIESHLYGAARLQPLARPTSNSACASNGGSKISYTSGTTGKPRGIALDQAFLDQTCQAVAAAIPYARIGRHLGVLPYSTLLENIAGIQVPLLLGRTIHAESSGRVGLTPELSIDPFKLQQTFNRINPNSLILTPQLLQLFCRLAEQGAIDPACLSFVAVGGARVGETLIRRARAAGIPAYEGYGLTEFGSVAILNTPQADRIGSVGKPLPGVRVIQALDGEICLETRFQHAGGERRQRVRTGDYGSIDSQGFVHIQGRKSNLIVLSSGRNVSPEWVETELNASPLLSQSYVYTGNGEALSALLLPAGPEIADPAIENEVDRINLNLPPYARVRNWQRLAIAFSRDNEMLTANGLLRREHIRRNLPMLVACSKACAPAIAAA